MRAGGFRVGRVDEITSARRRVDGERARDRVLELELDKDVEPLPVDTTRHRALALGPRPQVRGAGARRLATTPFRRATPSRWRTRPARRRGPRGRALDVPARDARRRPHRPLQGFGDGSTGRGPAINTDDRGAAAVPDPARAGDARPVGAGDGAARGCSRRSARAAAGGAGGRDPGGLDRRHGRHVRRHRPATRRRSRRRSRRRPPTLDAATASFRVQTPFLARFAELSPAPPARRGGAARRCRRSTPPSPPACPPSAHPGAGRATSRACSAPPRTWARTRSRLLALRDLRTAVQIAGPAVQFVAPYQTVCNYLDYFFTPLGTHLSEAVPGGTAQRILAKLLFGGQPNNLGTTESDAARRRARRRGPAGGAGPAGAALAAGQPGGGRRRARRLPERADGLPRAAS